MRDLAALPLAGKEVPPPQPKEGNGEVARSSNLPWRVRAPTPFIHRALEVSEDCAICAVDGVPAFQSAQSANFTFTSVAAVCFAA